MKRHAPSRRVRTLLAAACLPAAGLVTTSVPGFSQETRARRSAAALPVVAADADSARAQAGIAARRRSLLIEAERTAIDLASQSESAFRRGLMPLPDYLEQAGLVALIETESARAQGASESAAWQRQVDRLRDVRDRLSRFRQPASAGWPADLALAEWALADAEVQLATSADDPAALQAAAQRRSTWAAEHLQRRQIDAEIGAASPPVVLHAMSLVVASEDGGRVSDSATKREYLAELRRTQQMTAKWAEQGAGIGRADRLIQASAALEIETAVSIEADGRTAIDADAFHQAGASLQTLFTTQREFHQHGTAELHDLCRTWLTWRNLHQAASFDRDLVTNAERDGRADALQTLTELADRTGDRRGRIAADVTSVELFGQLDQIDALASGAGRDAGYLR